MKEKLALAVALSMVAAVSLLMAASFRPSPLRLDRADGSADHAYMSNTRPLTPSDRVLNRVGPGAGRGLFIVEDIIVSNTDRSLASTDKVGDGEPVIAINPLDPKQVLIQAGGEDWFQDVATLVKFDGCPQPWCPNPNQETRGSIFASADGGRTWTKDYAIPFPPGLAGYYPEGICTCDRVGDFGRDGRLVEVLMGYDDHTYAASSATPLDPSSWVYPTDPQGTAVPFCTQSPLVPQDQIVFSNTGSHGYCDQPQVMVLPDPKVPGQEDAYATYLKWGAFSGFNEPTVQVWNSVSHGTTAVNFTNAHEVYSFPVCCEGDQPAPLTPNLAFSDEWMPGDRLAGDSKTGTVYQLYEVPLSPAVLRPNPSGQQFDAKLGTYLLTQYRLTRSTDGGRTWAMGGDSGGIVVSTALAPAAANKFAMFNGLYGGFDAGAVDPSDGTVYYASGEYEPTTQSNAVAIRAIKPDGTIGQPTLLGGGHDTALPAVAVTNDGAVAVLYDTYDGVSPDGYAIVSGHLAVSHDHGATFKDDLLATWTSVDKEDPNDVKQRPLGDYQELKAVGDTVYGVFTANGAALGRPYADWDPIFVKAFVG